MATTDPKATTITTTTVPAIPVPESLPPPAAATTAKPRTARKDDPSTRDLIVQKIMVKTPGQGVGTKFLIEDLVPFAKEQGCLGVMLQCAHSPTGQQLLRSLVTKHGWLADGKLPPKKKNQPAELSFDAINARPIENLREIVPWIERVRLGYECNNAKKFIVDGKVYVLLQLSRAPRFYCPEIIQYQKATNAFSPCK